MADALDFSNWMGELPDRLTKVPLGHLAIPGSHTSFTCSLQKQAGVAVDQPGFIRNMVSCGCAPGRALLHRWCVSQTLSTVQQLNAGIRYFDLRVCKHPESGQFHFVHGLYGKEIVTSLMEVKSFVERNPREVVILDMNHFYNMAPESHDRLLAELVSFLDDLLVPVNGYQYKLWRLTLASVWQKPGRIILIYHNPFNAAKFTKIWNKTAIQSPCKDTSSVKVLLDFLETYYTNKDRPSGYSFHVWQGALTPGTRTVVKNFHKTLQSVLARRATEAFVNWVREKAPGEFRINICMVDAVEHADFIKEVIALNNLNMTSKQNLYNT